MVDPTKNRAQIGPRQRQFPFALVPMLALGGTLKSSL